jgi:RNA polymerase sigma-70 factor (ECF subfamily)
MKAVMKRRPARSTGVNGSVAISALAVTDSVELAFEALYRDSRDDLYAYAVTLLRDRSAAEDVTATAFERAYGKRACYRPRLGSRRAWLFGIARNAALDELRRRKRVATLADDHLGSGGEDLVDAAEQSVRRATVRAALRTLEPRDCELIALKFHAGLTTAELARVLGKSETNAGTMLHRAIQKLRKACHETA